jgi:hypothetical protein
MTVHASAQNPFFTRRYVADILQIPLNRVRLIQETLGGTFGGKEEGAGLLAARCAYLCRLLHRPVKMVFTREESFSKEQAAPFQFPTRRASKGTAVRCLEGDANRQFRRYKQSNAFNELAPSAHARARTYPQYRSRDLWRVHQQHPFRRVSRLLQSGTAVCAGAVH